jgi:hypothetical protein
LLAVSTADAGVDLHERARAGSHAAEVQGIGPG